MKETIKVEVGGKVAEITLVTPGAVFGLGTELMPAPGGPWIPPIRLPGPPDIGPKPPPICGPCPPYCPPTLGLPPICDPPICDPAVDRPKPPPKPKPG